jgi:2-dehydro-3-deoxyphosphogalactonate aldolase
MTLEEALVQVPVVAIIRGVRPDEAVAVGEALFEAGLKVIEIPLNSPEPFDSIARLAGAMQGRMVVGGGTILTPEACDRVADAGGTVSVSPNTDARVISRAMERGMVPLPGFGSASEAFLAVVAGARHLKLFPASTYGPGHVKALKEVLPRDVVVMPVGGVGPDQFAAWWTAGARGFGVGGDIYKPGRPLEEIAARGRAAVAAAARLAA